MVDVVIFEKYPKPSATPGSLEVKYIYDVKFNRYNSHLRRHVVQMFLHLISPSRSIQLILLSLQHSHQHYNRCSSANGGIHF